MGEKMSVLLWFRQDLRLNDNPALQAALEKKSPIVPIFIWAPEEEEPWAPGAASRSWLHHSLTSLDQSLRKLGSKLIVRKGPTLSTLENLVQETGARAVYWNRRYEPLVIERDQKIKTTLREKGIEIQSFNSALLLEPWEVKNSQEKPFQVFTPFSKHCFQRIPLFEIEKSPSQLPFPKEKISSLRIEDLKLTPSLPWDKNFYPFWKPGERGAHKNLNNFLENSIRAYETERDLPAHTGTSRLSPHLHFGEIGPKQVWRAAQNLSPSKGKNTFLKELLWREFAYHLLYHFPHTPTEPLRSEFKKFPWEKNERFLKAWQKGETGYPIVDAGMRELWQTGWMHNRVRMIAASFLVKDLLISWQEGARWFWETLVDADLANNTLGWQWVAGCGADAAPFFRIFNPSLQASKFDPKQAYIRQWVGQDQNYPVIVDHGLARIKALEALKKIKVDRQKKIR